MEIRIDAVLPAEAKLGEDFKSLLWIRNPDTKPLNPDQILKWLGVAKSVEAEKSLQNSTAEVKPITDRKLQSGDMVISVEAEGCEIIGQSKIQSYFSEKRDSPIIRFSFKPRKVGISTITYLLKQHDAEILSVKQQIRIVEEKQQMGINSEFKIDRNGSDTLVMTGGIQCPHCGYLNFVEKVLCAKCEKPLSTAEEPSAEVSGKTENLNPEKDKSNVKAGWGTSTFRANSQIVLHVRGNHKPLIGVLRDKLLIGRAGNADGPKPDLDLTEYDAYKKGVSRNHAEIMFKDDHVHIVDLRSGNGTFLNGRALSPYVPKVVRDGDEIRLGNLVMHIYFK